MRTESHIWRVRRDLSSYVYLFIDLDVSRAWVCLCVVLDLNAIVTKALPRVNANVTDIHSASASPG